MLAPTGISLEDLLLLLKAPNKEDMLRLLPLPPDSLTEVKKNFCLIHVSLVPVLGVVGEQDVDFFAIVSDKFQFNCIAAATNLRGWTTMAEAYENLIKSVEIAMFGNWQALLHACVSCSLRLSIQWIAACDLKDEKCKSGTCCGMGSSEGQNMIDVNYLHDCKHSSSSCILVPGGFGNHAVPGMTLAAKHAPENNAPFLGICLGMQICVFGLEKANNEEFDSRTPHPVVIFMPEEHMGSTMRWGSQGTVLQNPDYITLKQYDTDL
ncbi:CTP synthase-like [Elaeis guineensis]|uniref:CTP synthase-like n=1 Tax=Elaeis guineensis var. tenera TaxID=51953 RepID=UPI003C6CFE1B